MQNACHTIEEMSAIYRTENRVRVIGLNRRRFYRHIAAAAGFTTAGEHILAMSNAEWDDIPDGNNDMYALWSLLIPIVQTEPGERYMIAEQTAIPDGLPYASTGEKKSPLEKAIAASRKPVRYETTVPPRQIVAFSDALVDANRHENDVVLIERRLHVAKQYRLLSKERIKDYFDLSPHVTYAGWRPDPRFARYFKGWNGVSFLSRAFFSRSRELALIWATTADGSCSSFSWFFFKRTDTGWIRLNWKTDRRSECA